MRAQVGFWGLGTVPLLSCVDCVCYVRGGGALYNIADKNGLAEKTVLIVDDEEAVRSIVRAYLAELGVVVILAESVAEARSYLENFSVDIVLSDIAMPGGETGIDFLRWCRERNMIVPFILISGFVSPDDIRYALSQGVQYVLHKPFKKQQLIDAVISSFAVSDSYNNLLNNYIEEIERNQRMLMSAIAGFAAAIGARDGYTLLHSEQVADFATLLSREIGLDEKNIRNIGIAGKLHDIGKIGVPERILLKKTRLTPDERKIMRIHPEKAAEILGAVPFLSGVVAGVRHHHEWYDGSGYPDGLKGKEIPFTARILSICDAFSAMTSERPYRPATLWSEARKQIRENMSSQFDPELASIFLRIPSIAEKK